MRLRPGRKIVKDKMNVFNIEAAATLGAGAVPGPVERGVSRLVPVIVGLTRF
jgi:hypothetical protein